MKENDSESENENDIKLIEEKQDDNIKIDEKESQLLLLEKNIFNVKQIKEKYEPKINYLEKNPFRMSSITGLGLTIGALYPIITGASITISGLILSGLGITVFIPSLIGLGIYTVYKKFRNDNYIRYLNSLQKEESMEEERKIYLDIINYLKNEIMKLFKDDFLLKYNKIVKNQLNTLIEKIINKNEIYYNKLINEHKKQVENISNLNIMLVGNSGVGKSTLINEILKLENNRAEEQTNNERMSIQGWIKKYPINDKDTIYKNIYLWDTEGIEYSQDQKNDQQNHLQKVLDHINKNKSIPHQQINCIWFCINGQTFQPSEKEYIEKLLNVYNENFKIPIIFVYTQAFDSQSDHIESIKNKLENIFCKENKDKISLYWYYC